MTTQLLADSLPAPPQRVIEVEFLYLELDACNRCNGTDENLRTALGVMESALAATQTEVRLRSQLVDSLEQARELRFESSPTIRIDGVDIAGERIESECADCGELCGCAESVDCREWQYRGNNYHQAPTGLIVEALAAAVAGGRPVGRPVDEGSAFEIPENLQRVFAARRGDSASAESACCSTQEQTGWRTGDDARSGCACG